MSIPPTQPTENERRPWQFSITHLLVVTLLVAFCAAMCRVDALLGFWISLGTGFCYLTAIRARSAWRVHNEVVHHPQEYLNATIPNDLDRLLISTVGWSFLCVLSALIAFCCTCSTAASWLFFPPAKPNTFVNTNLVVAVVLGIGTAIAWLWITWPRIRRIDRVDESPRMLKSPNSDP